MIIMNGYALHEKFFYWLQSCCSGGDAHVKLKPRKTPSVAY